MAKIDVSGIAGFEEMSAEDKVNALLGYEIPENEPKPSEDAEKHWKELLNKANSQAAEFKRQLREKQTEQERLEADRIEKENALNEKLAEYEHRDLVNGYKDRLVSIGYDTDTALSMASKLPKGLGEDFFESQREFLDRKTKEIENKIINNQPTPSPGSPIGKELQEKAEMDKIRKWAGLK